MSTAAKQIKDNCLYCGNNPVSHHWTWFNETMAVIFNPLIAFLTDNFLMQRFNRLFDHIFSLVGKILEKAGFLSYVKERPNKLSHRTEVLWDEADSRGWRFERLIFFGKDLDYYRVFVKNDHPILFSGLPRPHYMPGLGDWWIDDKYLVKKVLSAKGLPIPKGGGFSNYNSLLRVFKKLDKPVIIKPRLGSRGRHTTTFINSEEELFKAYKRAKQLCYWVIMEEHLIGDVYRGTMIGSKLVGVLSGNPPRITGDGQSTILQLIDLKNQNRHEGVSVFVPSDYTKEFLKKIGYNLNSVLPMGTTIDLTEKIGVSYGGSSAEVTQQTHPKIKDILEQAAKAIGDPMIGFDFIIKDISADPDNQKWGIIECNGLPFINLHHDPIEGPPINAAAAVWDFVENNLNYY
ncbi:MAG: ATP-grasp domain-containing protein [Patescibacteria group bacterium]|nr:MAG: ATP-grasp domain-containing protein [Patescibacteria group bacterium]